MPTPTSTSQTSTQTPTAQTPPTQPPPAQTPAAQIPAAAQVQSEFLQYLPTIYSEDPFAGRFLLAFEEVFLDLESTVARLANFFTPHAAPKEFLPWLAKWTAFSLRADLDENQQRDFIANVIQLYRWRGSKANLQRLLKIFTGGEAVVTEDAGTPHYFYVALSLPKEWREKPVEFLGRKKEIAYDLIDLEKPAHTYYKLDFIYPSMQVGVRSTVGKDTVLGVGIRE
jgi:phage tail-like protein